MSKSNNILEIGSGQGFNASVLAKNKNNKVYGIDLSKEDILISRKRYPGITFHRMSAEKLIFQNNCFDEVYALDVLEHVDNLKKVLSEVSRVLKKNGVFKINIPHYKSEAWLLKLRPTFPKEIHHVRVFKDNELDNILIKYGFVINKKARKGFLQHLELFFLFNRNIKSKTQLSIGSWRDNYFTKFIHVALLYFDPSILTTPLVYFPIWIITVPIGYCVNFLGNIFLPKSLYYEARKK